MKTKKRIIFLTCLLLALLGVYASLVQHASVEEPVHVEATPAPVVEKTGEAMVKAPPLQPTVALALPKHYLIPAVPFTVQAPFAEWSNPMFQDACEEASIIMAHAWAAEKKLTKDQAKESIKALAQYQNKTFGQAVDTSIEDTEKMLTDFFETKTAVVKRGMTLRDMKEALTADQLVIVPTDGRKLKNPNFKAPGPPRHMLVIVGYDDETNEFVVNDPGTRKGERYRYDQDLLYAAILDYPTGKHVAASSTDKVMLTVAKE